MAHFLTTAPAIARQFPDVDVLFVGAGTTGTLMGCARYFRHRPAARRCGSSPWTVEGSVTFGRAGRARG
jgi:cysteine synthase